MGSPFVHILVTEDNTASPTWRAVFSPWVHEALACCFARRSVMISLGANFWLYFHDFLGSHIVSTMHMTQLKWDLNSNDHGWVHRGEDNCLVAASGPYWLQNAISCKVHQNSEMLAKEKKNSLKYVLELIKSGISPSWSSVMVTYMVMSQSQPS